MNRAFVSVFSLLVSTDRDDLCVVALKWTNEVFPFEVGGAIVNANQEGVMQEGFALRDTADDLTCGALRDAVGVLLLQQDALFAADGQDCGALRDAVVVRSVCQYALLCLLLEVSERLVCKAGFVVLLVCHVWWHRRAALQRRFNGLVLRRAGRRTGQKTGNACVTAAGATV
jgi:hypothetical protein